MIDESELFDADGSPSLQNADRVVGKKPACPPVLDRRVFITPSFPPPRPIYLSYRRYPRQFVTSSSTKIVDGVVSEKAENKVATMLTHLKKLLGIGNPPSITPHRDLRPHRIVSIMCSTADP